MIALVLGKEHAWKRKLSMKKLQKILDKVQKYYLIYIDKDYK